MKIIGIDAEKCTKCRMCVEECNLNLYQNSTDGENTILKVTYNDPHDACIGCGHCLSICSSNAIIYESNDTSLEINNNLGKDIDYQTLMTFLRTRRSIRRFRKKPVSKEEIKAVLEVCRYAPSAHNNQAWKYVVLTDPDKIQILLDITIEYVKSLNKKLQMAKRFRFMLPKEIRNEILQPAVTETLKNMVKRLENGEDLIFHDAPVVIICYSNSTGFVTMAAVDVGIALTHAMLSAHSRGLGTCWIGFAQEALNESKKNKKCLGIPEGTFMSGVLTLGYPASKYYKIPPRKNLDVSWNPEPNVY